jgi:hypothetical protein
MGCPNRCKGCQCNLCLVQRTSPFANNKVSAIDYYLCRRFRITSSVDDPCLASHYDTGERIAERLGAFECLSAVLVPGGLDDE